MKYRLICFFMMSLMVLTGQEMMTEATSAFSSGEVSLSGGNLSLERIDYTIDFGKIEQPKKVTTYSITSEATINDTRENRTGWELSIRQPTQQNWSNHLALAIGENKTPLNESPQRAMIQRQEMAEINQSKAVKLWLIVDPQVKVGRYQTTLQWELAAVPNSEN